MSTNSIPPFPDTSDVEETWGTRVRCDAMSARGKGREKKGEEGSFGSAAEPVP